MKFKTKKIRDLGIVFDRILSFHFHIDFIVSKAYSMLGFMMMLRL